MNSDNYMLIQSNSQRALQPELELGFGHFLINQCVDAAFCLGTNAEFLYVNDATCRMMEYSREELLEMTLHDVDIDFPLHNWSEQWRVLAKLGLRKPLTFKSRYRTKTGRVFLVEISVTHVEYRGREFGCAFVREKSDEIVELSVQKWIDELREAKNHLQQEVSQLKKRRQN